MHKDYSYSQRIAACLISVTSAFFVSAAPAIAESSRKATEPSEKIGERQLISQVLEHNIELKFYESEIAAAQGDRVSAGTWANPQFDSTLGNKQVQADSSTTNGVTWSIALTQTFEWPGRIELRKSIADKQISLAKIGLAQFKSALAFRAQALLYDLYRSQEKVRISREVTSRYQKLSGVLSSRAMAGVNPLLEKRIIEAAILGLEATLTEAELDGQKAILELNELRGQPLDSPLSIEPIHINFSPPPSAATLLLSARDNNFSYLQKKTELEQQELKVKLARNERHPAFSVGPYLTNERSGDDETQIGVSFSIPLPMWDSNSGKIAVEAAHQLQATASLVALERSLERRIFESRIEYEIKLAKVKKWREETIKDFQEAASLADEHYRAGAVPVATYIEVQKQYLESFETLLRIRRDTLAAQQQLEQLTGAELDSFNPTIALGRPQDD